MEKQKRKSKRKWKVGLFLQLTIGAVIGFFGGDYIINMFVAADWNIINIVTLVIFIFLAVFININVHEFGHFLVGKLFGFQLLLYRVGIFSWSYENGKMKFSIIKNKGYSGLCAMIPLQQNLPDYKILLHGAGGILLNILSGLVFLFAAYLFPGLPQQVTTFLYVLGSIALIFGFVNVLPFTSENSPTDGKIIWGLIQKKPFAQKIIVANGINSQLAAGIRPRELSIPPFVENDNLQFFDLFAILHLYYKALDNQNRENILYYANFLEENIEIFPYASRPGLYYEFCFCASIQGDAEKAKLYYQKAGKILQSDKDVNGLRVKAYYAYYILKQDEEALLFCKKALAVSEKFPIKGLGIMEKDLVIDLKNIIINGKHDTTRTANFD